MLSFVYNHSYFTTQATPTNITDPTPCQDKLDDLILIEKRLENWFVKQSQSSVRFTGNVRKRFESLPVDNSHVEFGLLNIAKSADGVITGALCKNKPEEVLKGDCSLNKRMKKILNNPRNLFNNISQCTLNFQFEPNDDVRENSFLSGMIADYHTSHFYFLL